MALGKGRWRVPGGVRLLGVRIAVLVALLSVTPTWARAAAEARKTLRTSRRESLATQVGGERAPGFLEAVDRIREAVPADGAYLVLVDPYGPGALTGIALRHALLPRKAVLLQRFQELPGKPSVQLRATVVIDSDEFAPVVTGGVLLFEPFDPGSLGVEDESFLASVDDLFIDSTGLIRIRGWCQGDGAVSCDVAAVLVDGISVPISQISREPRPDVEAVVPAVGPCPRAGYRLTLAKGVAVGPRDPVRVVFRTADGRWRIYPERFAERAR
jgi:hypothetical protein